MSELIDDVAQSALIVHVPQAEPAVSRWREFYDPAARWGVPAHITVVYPFVPPDAIDDDLRDRVAAVVSRIEPFDFVLDEVDQFGTEVLYLAPKPQDRFVALITAIVDAWPEHQPYGGAHADVVPHLTIAHTNRGASFSAIRSRVSEQLPIRGRADAVSLMTGTLAAASWETVHEFALGPRRNVPLSYPPNTADGYQVTDQHQPEPVSDDTRERRSGEDRRRGDRRQGDRRKTDVPVAVDRRGGTDRRRGERRSGADRRAE